MEVLDPRSALLSNYEVLALLKELENEHLERSKAAVRIKKEEEVSGHHHAHTSTTTLPEISENLRTIQVEAIQYLSSSFLPTTSQTPDGIAKLTKNLAAYELTKAEKLQMVNLAPTVPVELYVIVEELEDRLGDSMDAILETVKASLSAPPTVNGALTTTTAAAQQVTFTSTASSLLQDPTTSTTWGDADADAIIDDLEFVDQGEGDEIEGDLDVEED